MAVCKTVAFGLNKFEPYHAHNGESPAGHGCCLENRLGVKASGVRISFSPQHIIIQRRVDRAVMCQPAKLGLPVILVQRFDSFTLRKCLYDLDDDSGFEEIRYQIN